MHHVAQISAARSFKFEACLSALLPKSEVNLFTLTFPPQNFVRSHLQNADHLRQYAQSCTPVVLVPSRRHRSSPADLRQFP